MYEGNGGHQIFEINDLLTPEECNSFIHQIESKTNVIRFTTSSDFKNDKYKDMRLAQWFFNKLPENTDFKRPFDLIITGMYVPGQSFGLHTDTGAYYNVQTKERSRYTMIIYLNDCKGGETQFYDNKGIPICRIKPKQGKCLIFDIDLFHQGLTVTKGNKYWIGMEIIGNF